MTDLNKPPRLWVSPGGTVMIDLDKVSSSVLVQGLNEYLAVASPGNVVNLYGADIMVSFTRAWVAYLTPRAQERL